MTSTALIDQLTSVAEKLGVEIYTETAAKSLLQDADGKIVGVEAQKADGTKVTLSAANGVVLACGGYVLMRLWPRSMIITGETIFQIEH